MACNNKRNCCRNRNTCKECVTKRVSGCPCNSDCQWFPVEEMSPVEREMRFCCDESGCCGLFPQDCRNKFWPDFAHPRWLCCKDLYCARKCC